MRAANPLLSSITWIVDQLNQASTEQVLDLFLNDKAAISSLLHDLHDGLALGHVCGAHYGTRFFPVLLSRIVVLVFATYRTTSPPLMLDHVNQC